MNERRKFLQMAGLTGITSLVAIRSANALDSCDFRPNAQQPLGPFYPVNFPLDTDIDLTRLAGRGARAKGELVIVQGIVTDEYCRPVPGAIVEIWQACYSGKYNHPSDTTTSPLDENFQYYGVMKTNAKGEYGFKTIKPGSYQASPTWRRPPHIHYKVSLSGYRELVSQMYFEGDSLNQTDLILQELHKEEQKKVVVSFQPQLVYGENVLRGRFDLTLRKA